MNERLSHRSVLAIAVPVMVSNVSTPLIGIVDTAIVGRIPGPAYIGAVAVGALIFTFVFWAFGFLRMGTTGLTAQALGAQALDEVVACLGRALMLAACAGGALMLLQQPIRMLAFHLLEGSAEVETLAAAYFDIRIWAAPATLVNYALLGWFIGLGRTDVGLLLQLVLNLSNIVLDAVFVLGFGLDVRGVAAGTLIAEYLAAGAGIAIALRYVRGLGVSLDSRGWLESRKVQRTIVVNRDIMIRSLALIFVFVWFMSRSAADTDVVLAANAILMHFVSTSAYFLDGLAFAAEALVGKAIGAAHRSGLIAAMKMTTYWAFAVAVVCVMLLYACGPLFIDALTTEPAVRAAARAYLPWAAFAPLLGVWAFQLDGVFIGATRTAAMRNAMLMSTAIFLLAWWSLLPYANHGLWASLYVNYLARIATLAVCLGALIRSVPREEGRP